MGLGRWPQSAQNGNADQVFQVGETGAHHFGDVLGGGRIHGAQNADAARNVLISFNETHLLKLVKIIVNQRGGFYLDAVPDLADRRAVARLLWKRVRNSIILRCRSLKPSLLRAIGSLLLNHCALRSCCWFFLNQDVCSWFEVSNAHLEPTTFHLLRRTCYQYITRTYVRCQVVNEGYFGQKFLYGIENRQETCIIPAALEIS